MLIIGCEADRAHESHMRANPASRRAMWPPMRMHQAADVSWLISLTPCDKAATLETAICTFAEALAALAPILEAWSTQSYAICGRVPFAPKCIAFTHAPSICERRKCHACWLGSCLLIVAYLRPTIVGSSAQAHPGILVDFKSMATSALA